MTFGHPYTMELSLGKEDPDLMTGAKFIIGTEMKLYA